MAVKYKMDEDALDTLDRRVRSGIEALKTHDSYASEEQETTARDLVSDILTALFGPAGYCVPKNPEHASSVYEVRLDPERWELAKVFLDTALESWEGDAEDYTATLGTMDEPDKTRTITLAISESELAERLGVSVEQIDAQDYFGAIRDFGEIVSHEG